MQPTWEKTKKFEGRGNNGVLLEGYWRVIGEVPEDERNVIVVFERDSPSDELVILLDYSS